MMKCVVLIAILCVAPCAFQDTWDEYDAWYDEFDKIFEGGQPNDDDRIAPEQPPNRNDDYNIEHDYKDYEIEDNREEKSNIENGQQFIEEPIAEQNDESAIVDFDALQQILNDDKDDASPIDKLSSDEQDLLHQLMDDKEPMVKITFKENDGDENKDENPNVELSVGDKEENIEDDKGILSDIEDETLQILEDTRSNFDEENLNDSVDLKEKIDNILESDIQENIHNIVQETRRILEETNGEFDENKNENDDIAEILNDKKDSQQDNSDDTEDIKVEEMEAKIPEIEIQPDIQDIIDETQQILEDTNVDFDDKIDIQPNIQDILDETQLILEDTNGDFDDKIDIQPNIQDILDETQLILEDTNGDFDDKIDIQPNIQDILDETQQILEDTNLDFDDNNYQKPLQESDGDKTNSDEDTVDKVYQDLNADLDKLLETWQKLSEGDESENNEEIDEIAQNNNDEVIAEPNADDAYGRDEIGDEVKEENFDFEGEARILAMRDDYYESISDKDLSELFKEFEEIDDENNDEAAGQENKIVYVNDALDANSGEDSNKNDKEFHSADLEDSIALFMGADRDSADDVLNNADSSNDDLDKQIANDDEQKADVIDTKTDNSETIPEVDLQNTEQSKSDDLDIPEVKSDDKVTPTKDVEDLNSAELKELTEQFVTLHETEIKMDRDETPTYITLNANEAVVVTSLGYPNAYPTDSGIMDWILEGPGTGIEVNVTDLAINSAMGHYLMLKPGQTDESGDQGIVFAYRIDSERRYRFRDVNRMFIRFNPVGGMSFSRGFQLSARIIEAPASDSNDQQELPEPESLIPAPRETTTLFLAGVNTTTFQELREQFRTILADMATMYINANNIDPGMNDTIEVTQITRSYVCNVNWPGFDSCVEVTFGIPLIYEDDVRPRLTEGELIDMWYTYAGRDPFAARLRLMGINDYSVPQDSYILTVWVVVGVAVVIAASMLAFALWRYSCVENYTRMQEFSDTDSIHDKKRGLDMYPTPHQTLPPLYTENDYKWADRTFDDSTRVDMGGFTNNTFTRDELSDESEEEVVTARDSKASGKPSDQASAKRERSGSVSRAADAAI